ncbi:Mitogen-activated protein kinase kinase [Actinidia chinensis var. chinensis]|uniref:Mitogen-activated protein kinase kinase n=1 Tax=Actinidia chinensis var. chinensis TaxID=1590841 RepID=A0A2R6QFZ9_ACTCC|nr:Mitogen-activated protein kinase kinase [Actinidia chinensis var. chinensis]
MAVKSAEISVSGSILKEREALTNIGRCPNVIRCFGDKITIGENGEMVYNLLLEFASGGTLADLIKKPGGSGMSESDKKDVGAKFKVKIGDFGLAKRVNQNKKGKLDPYMRGTPTYLSPEVVTDCIQEPPSDIWAFGCIEFEMVTGKPQWFHKQDMNAEALLCMIGEGLVDDDDDDNDEVEEGDESLVADEVDSWMILFESDE